MEKQETLEEASNNFAIKEIEQCTSYHDLHYGFNGGAKWMQERMYSEEDLKQFAWQCVANFLSNRNNKVEQNLVEVIIDRNNLEFEQFKKK
jgi:hypothetical protein